MVAIDEVEICFSENQNMLREQNHMHIPHVQQNNKNVQISINIHTLHNQKNGQNQKSN